MTRSVLGTLFDWARGRFRASSASAVSEIPWSSVALQPDMTTSDLVPYDENLLERARTQWQFGDWESLARLDRETLQHHPDRAKLALLVASGHLQSNNSTVARQFIRLAQDWGCSKKIIAQILISNVHNSLGRAAATSGNQSKASEHFGNAIAIGTPGSEVRLVAQARLGEQLRQLGLPGLTEASPVHAPDKGMLAQIPTSDGLHTINEKLRHQQEALEHQLKKQADELAQTRKSLESAVTREMRAAAKRIEAFIGVQNYFSTGELPNLSVEKNDWPVGPDLALYLIELLEAGDYDLVIEFGSGVSTVIIAKTLKKIRALQRDKPVAKVISFEHLEQYFAKTYASLELAGLTQTVQLTLAPLVPYAAENGNTYQYYDCLEVFAELTKEWSSAGRKVLLVVDGPPGITGKHARYPAVPIAVHFLRGAQIDVLLDDYSRADEKEIAELWKSDVLAAGLNYAFAVRDLERGACLVSIRSEKRTEW